MNEPPQLRVGLLLCDDVDDDAQARYGTYSDMFRNSIAAVDGGLALHPVRCDRGELPDSPDDFDAYLISGSRHAVYDPQPWIAQLQEFVRGCRARRKKTVGICFGHQLIAHALGGEARKATAGWGLGVHAARITCPQPWMENGGPDTYRLIAIHQDQVVALPPGFRVIATSDFCPVNLFTGDGVMLGIQGHPEFDKAFCEYRIHSRRAQLDPGVYRRSLDSLAQLDPDSRRVSGWIARFIRSPGGAIGC